jgi:methylphosphotriester-DNA--protein-cysteine methyltransferase
MAALAQDPKAKPAAPAKPAPAAAAAKAAPAAGIVANKESKTFHRADCKAAAKIKDANKTTFASAAEAQKAGYKACKVCKP